MAYPRADLTGRRFGRLVAVKPTHDSYGGVTQWACRCDCGAEHVALTTCLMSGDTKSCGCLRREKFATVRGLRWAVRS